MKSRQEQRSEETKEQILKAAGTLFAKKGFDSVSIREIAKDAGCSHTTIYLYFKDKEALLQELSMPALEKLHEQLKVVAHMATVSAEDKLKRISHEYIQFCLENRSMYDVFFNAKSTRVDEVEALLEINKLRLETFALMKQVLQDCLSISNNELLLNFSRIYYYHLNGILSTYSYLHEPITELMKRLTPTFDLTVEVLILGFKEKIRKKGNE
ncbi:TetR/AcrR family transcriptional regulator [Lederbergia wuyishanensis]|uniref:AcrR family transcriptional regulator n=1 Tax=Lederbergia wuyishanensis TaxID=1347903 RepID=A0ABU0D809_9BACI|nr:TetR/AcrR family transcriptional regulator [Lederbergia wuyishanensis]MCJ8009347.1 TetR/AcrR family transcriptional regulator [Lederbergia wuyishanensis]MDQ0344518.1 AcrR family transcriptional regulator [Lederbergia wuyishanensis]